MATAFFDCFGGASGDMIVAALIDAGASVSTLRSELARLGLTGCDISADRTQRGALTGMSFAVQVASDPLPHHRHLADILALLDRAAYPERVDARARGIFRRLAAAEARVHGCPIEEVHFHEAGAADSIIDVVAAAAAMEALGIERVVCSPIPLGRGSVQTAHGELPLPAPATAELMREGEIAPSDYPAELCTPTGAAILTTLAEGSFGALPAMKLGSIGYGAGSREDPGRVNMLRVFVGQESREGQVDTVVELATNLDDTTGALVGAVIEMLLAAGALDAWAEAVTMKKSRPALRVGVLCEPADVGRMEEILFGQTHTIGIRRQTCARSKLSRRWVTVETPYGCVRVKVSVSHTKGEVGTAAPEFDDCARAAESHHVPIKEVQAAAVQAYRSRDPGKGTES